MQRTTVHILLAMAWLAPVLSLEPRLFAEETKIDVRVRSQGAMFIGTSMGGARILIRDAETGELLAEGVTAGSTGDRDRIMKQKHQISDSLSTPDAAVFYASVDIDRPTSQFKAEITVLKPGAYEVNVYAHDPENGNVGIDKTTFIVAQ